MIIVLKSGISDSDVQDVCQRITEMGYGPHVIRGEFKTIVAAVGEERGRPDLRLLEALEWRAGDPNAIQQLGVAYATLQCAELLARGAPGIHFYTLNRSPSTRAILSALNLLRPWVRREVVRT